MSMSRRVFLGTGAAAGVAVAVGTPASAARPDIGVSAYAFPLTAVRLLPGPFPENAARTHAYLNFLDPDRLLHTFRLNVGLPSSATPCGGWESPTTELRGHSIGHVLTALAQAYASTGDAAFKTKGDYLVAELALCQARATAAGFNTGYLSAFPESFIDRVEAAAAGLGALLHAAQDHGRAARHAPAGRQRAGAHRADRHGRLGEVPQRPADATTQRQNMLRHRVRRHERGADQPLPADRRTPRT